MTPETLATILDAGPGAFVLWFSQQPAEQEYDAFDGHVSQARYAERLDEPFKPCPVATWLTSQGFDRWYVMPRYCYREVGSIPAEVPNPEWAEDFQRIFFYAQDSEGRDEYGDKILLTTKNLWDVLPYEYTADIVPNWGA